MNHTSVATQMNLKILHFAMYGRCFFDRLTQTYILVLIN